MPSTEKQGRRHSSFVTLAVLDESKQIEVDLSDVKITYYMDSGPGGQHRNRTLSGVRVVHPSGLVVTCAETRSQYQNRLKAMAEMERRLREEASGELHDERNADRVAQTNERGWTWTQWRDSVVDRRTGRTGQYKALTKGKGWDKMAR